MTAHALADWVAAAVWSQHPRLAVIDSDLMARLLAEQGAADLNAYLRALADALGHPFGLQVPVDDWLFQAPSTWTEDRTRGWLGGYAAELHRLCGLTSLADPRVFIRGYRS